MTYKLRFDKKAKKEYDKLGGSVKIEFKNKLKDVIQNPHIESKKLRGNLKGHYKIKLRASGYRAIYRVEDEIVTVTVIKIGKRQDIYN